MGDTPSMGDTRSPSGETRTRRVVALFVLPYVLLGLAWLASNPVAAAPDEDAHLVKALGIARFDIGEPLGTRVDGPTPGAVRNASITRVVSIPAALDPSGYACFKFEADVTADCQPAPPASSADVRVATTVGAYPPFAYLPMGLAARAASTPTQAFTQGRLVVLAETTALLWLACQHLVRWLGRRALLGVAVALTPVAVFCTAILNTSGLEIFGALGVAAAVAVATRRPESLTARRTQVLVLVSGSALVLSRQLGIVTMAALVLLLLAVGGWPIVRAALRRGSWLLVTVVALLGVQVVAVVGWELRFDHPVLLGPWASRQSLVDFVAQLPQLVHEGVGWFGWLDTRLPTWFTSLWAGVVAVLVGVALALGSRRDRVVLAAMVIAGLVVAYVTYARVFHPVGAGLQGRHLLPFFAIVPVLAGIVVSERLPRPTLALLPVLAVGLPALQLIGLHLNGKRYAVGLTGGPLWFPPAARWAPPLGWVPWLVLGLVACLAMAAGWLWLARSCPAPKGSGPPAA